MLGLADLSAIEKMARDCKPSWSLLITCQITGGPHQLHLAGRNAGVWSKNFQSMLLPVIAITDRVCPAEVAPLGAHQLTSTSYLASSHRFPTLAFQPLRLSLGGLAKTLSPRVARDGITANCVPARIATDRIRFSVT